MQRNVVNNSNVVINLSNQELEEGLVASDYSIDFVNNDKKHLGLFRIEENISNHRGDQDDADGLRITITSPDNWKFVHETNGTSTREYSIDVYKIIRVRTDHWSAAAWYDILKTKNDPDFDTVDSEADTSVSLTSGESGEKYFYASYSGFDTPRAIRMYVTNIFEYDFSIRLKPESGYLEPGYYTTRINVTISGFYSHKVSDNGLSVEQKGRQGDTTYQIVLRGYVGDYEDNSSTYSFIVNSARDTYKMDLGITTEDSQANPYQVANVQFLYALSNKDDPTTNAESKFKLYISPSSNIRQTYVNGVNPYFFYERGTELLAREDSNTVYYKLCKSSGSSYSIASDAGIGNWTYEIIPEYNTGYTTANKKYNETWRIDEFVYLYIVDAPDVVSNTDARHNATHDSGIYYSYIYFTLVVN